MSQRKIDPIEKGKVVGDVKDRETLALVSTAQATPKPVIAGSRSEGVFEPRREICFKGGVGLDFSEAEDADFPHAGQGGGFFPQEAAPQGEAMEGLEGEDRGPDGVLGAKRNVGPDSPVDAAVLFRGWGW